MTFLLILYRIAKSSLELFLEISPFLLFGFLFAGLLHGFINRDKIFAHLGERTWLSVIKASLFGVPLPLCSCGVIPVAYSLRKSGATKGATLSFLISTPTTGVDSILATYGLLGPLFAIVRPLAAFFGGIFAGGIANAIFKEDKPTEAKLSCPHCKETHPHTHTLKEKLISGMHYGFFELVEDIGKWVVIGVIIGGVITSLVPEGFVGKYLDRLFLNYLAMLLIAIPLYVCATGSIPIAASLILKGLSPGSALVFLIAGPATNATTITVLSKILGKKGVVLYLFVIIATAFIFGYVFDIMVKTLNIDIYGRHMYMIPLWVRMFSSALLSGLIIKTSFRAHY